MTAAVRPVRPDPAARPGLHPSGVSGAVVRGLSGVWLPALGAAAWVLLSRSRTYSYAFIPPHDLARGLVEVLESGDLPAGLLASLQKMLLALVLAAPAGVLFGCGLGASRALDRAVGPLFHALRQVPYLGLAPLMGLWLGTGDVAKIVLVFLAVFYPVVLSTYQGVRAIDVRYLEVARALRLGKRRVLRSLLFPAVAPYVYTGLSQAIPFAWIATVGSELLLPSGAGVGTMMQAAEAAGRLDVVLVAMMSVTAASLAIDRLLKGAGRRVMRWRNDGWSRA